MQKTCFYKQIKSHIAMTKSHGSGVFKVQGRFSLRVMTLVSIIDRARAIKLKLFYKQYECHKFVLINVNHRPRFCKAISPISKTGNSSSGSLHIRP